MVHSILVLGATAVSGLAFLDEVARLPQASRPHLTLYVRSPDKLPASAGDVARIVKGQLTDEVALSSALEGVDTVVSFLGAYPSLSAFFFRTKTTPIADSLKVAHSVMKERGVKRLLVLSTPSYKVGGDKFPNWSWTMSLTVPHLLIPQAHAEMGAIGRVGASDNDFEWTVFRVPFLNNGSGDLPVYSTGVLGTDFQRSASISRASIGRWILKEVEERKWIRAAPVLAN